MRGTGLEAASIAKVNDKLLVSVRVLCNTKNNANITYADKMGA
jgi:hypothetical protein